MNSIREARIGSGRFPRGLVPRRWTLWPAQDVAEGQERQDEQEEQRCHRCHAHSAVRAHELHEEYCDQHSLRRSDHQVQYGVAGAEVDVCAGRRERKQREKRAPGVDERIVREVSGLAVTPYDLPDGCLAGYFPELNPLVPLDHHDQA